MTLFAILASFIKHSKMLPFKADKTASQTPLHYAFKTGNIEMALWIMQIVKKELGVDSYQELINTLDLVNYLDLTNDFRME